MAKKAAAKPKAAVKPKKAAPSPTKAVDIPSPVDAGATEAAPEVDPAAQDKTVEDAQELAHVMAETARPPTPESHPHLFDDFGNLK